MIRAAFIVLIATTIISNFNVNAQTPACGVNEARYPCGRRCEMRCEDTTAPNICERGLRCLGFSCRCKNGFARVATTNQCVPVAECP